MKLYYDMLVPYMPDAVTNEAGEMVTDERRAAGRKAMMELANFQTSGNALQLYQAAIFACTYAEQDLVQTILNITAEDSAIVISENTPIGDMIDTAAKELFKSIKPDMEFNCDVFVANVLTAAHTIMRMPAPNAQAPEPDSEPAEPEANPQ